MLPNASRDLGNEICTPRPGQALADSSGSAGLEAYQQHAHERMTGYAPLACPTRIAGLHMTAQPSRTLPPISSPAKSKVLTRSTQHNEV